MTILQEFGAFEDQIKAELDKNLPLLSTTKILMECVRNGMGREEAYELIKKHSTKSDDFFADLSQESGFPLNREQLESFVENPAEFAGNAQNQCDELQKLISIKTRQVSRFELSDIR
jgi:adenylosuccinate lyase